jgi:putative phage-type endonuclease
MTDDLVQGSAEWRMARCGSLGASAIADALAKTKTGWGASRANVMARLILERLTGVPQDIYQTQAMLDGVEREPEARAAYQFMTSAEVREVGLIMHPILAGTHASPDGLIGEDGLLEIKCPQPAAHLATLLGEPIPQKYIYQMLWQMRCANRAWCDFVSFNPQFPPEMQLFIQRIRRDDAAIFDMEKDIGAFLTELDEKVAALRSRYLTAEAA